MGGHWFPIWGVRLQAPRVRLRAIRETEMAALVELVGGGIHDPAMMPFEVPWTDTPSPLREQEAYAFWLGCWAGITPQGWRIPFAADVDGEVVGTQDLAATGWEQRRAVETGSWIGRAHQGRGYGCEMRAAVLHLAFEHLGAERAESAAFEDNAASIRVSEELGYRHSGDRLAARRGVSARQVCFSLDRDDWADSVAADIAVTVEGVDDAVLAQLGAADPG